MNVLNMCCRRLQMPCFRYFRRRITRLLQMSFVLAIMLAIVLIVFEFNRVMSQQQLASNKSIKVRHNIHSEAQDAIDYIAANMQLRFDVLPMQTAQITLFNNGSKPIRPAKWGFYGCTMGVFGASNARGHVLGGSNVTLTHINGCLYKFEPTDQFQPIASGTSVKFQFRSSPIKARTDLTPNWYIAAEGVIPRTIANTASEDLSFIFADDQKPSWDRYNSISASDLGHAPLLVIPTPENIVSSDKTRLVFISKEWTVCGVERLNNELRYLAGKLELSVCSLLNSKSKVINLVLTTPDINQRISPTAHESYDLQVDDAKEVITITGQQPAGVFYGVQTLLALMNYKGEVPQVSIKDSPRFPYRGLMVDVGRNFIPKNEILKLLDVMAMYKMNKFHFHLTENEGWRLQIPGIEELTEIGAKRCHDLQEKSCILSQLGSGPDTSTSGTGYYSTEDYREILRHAKERHIQVIPEFDFPGHSHAAIKSMIARHDRLVKEGKENEAKEFLLNDFNDKSRYFSVQHFTDEATNPCLSSTYKFINHVISILVSIHSDIQPLTLFHFGGDEVSNGAWTDSPACTKFANSTLGEKQTLSKMYLKEYFIQRLSEITHSQNLDLGGWSDAFFGQGGALTRSSSLKNTDLYAYYWSLSGDVKRLRVLVEGGYKVVLTTPDFVYFDHPYEPDYEERGKYWATSFIDTRKVFEYSPSELSKDILNYSENIMGIEAAFWGETVRTADQMYSMLFPRLLVFAERAWHKASWENITDGGRHGVRTGEWERFANTLGYRELGRLDKMGVAYRVPPPAARMIQGKLSIKTTLPGLKAEYSTDGGLTWHDVTPEMKINGKITMKTRSPDMKRFSRLVEFVSNVK